MFGKQAVEGALAVWYWLWGMPVNSGGQLSVAAGESAIDNQITVVQQLADAVGTQEAAVEQIADIINENETRAQGLERQIGRLVSEKTEEADSAALDLVAELEAIEGGLPDLEAKLAQATANFEHGQEQLKLQEQELKRMKYQQKQNAANQRVNAALEKATKTMKSVEIKGTSTLDKATEAIKRRGSEAQGKSNAHSSLGSSDRMAAKASAAARLERFRQ